MPLSKPAPAPSSEGKTANGGPPQEVKAKPPPMKLTGIIILPPSYRRMQQRQEGDRSSSSSNSDERSESLAHSSSVPNLRGDDDEGLAVDDDEEEEGRRRRRLSTSTSSLNVRFAPLPQLAPRKRKSSAPLGVASRAAMMRKRRAGMPGYDSNGDPLPPTPPMWTDEEIQRQTERMMAERNGGQSRDHYAEDPIVLLGRKMKSAWRKMNNNHNSKNAKQPNGDPEKGGGGGGTEAPPPAVVAAERVVLAPLPGGQVSGTVGQQQEEGGVWEEEVSSRFAVPVSGEQAGATVVDPDANPDGRYPWLAQLAGLSDSPIRENGDPAGRPGTLYLSLPEDESAGSSARSSIVLSRDSDSDSPPPTAVPFVVTTPTDGVPPPSNS